MFLWCVLVVYLVVRICHHIPKLLILSSSLVQIQCHKHDRLSDYLKRWRVFKDHIYTIFLKGFIGVSKAVSVRHWLFNHPNPWRVVLTLVTITKHLLQQNIEPFCTPNIGVGIRRLMCASGSCLMNTCLPWLKWSLQTLY